MVIFSKWLRRVAAKYHRIILFLFSLTPKRCDFNPKISYTKSPHNKNQFFFFIIRYRCAYFPSPKLEFKIPLFFKLYDFKSQVLHNSTVYYFRRSADRSDVSHVVTKSPLVALLFLNLLVYNTVPKLQGVYLNK